MNDSGAHATHGPAPTLQIEPWSSERSLFALNVAVAAVVWGVSLMTVTGWVYTILAGLVVCVLHLTFVAHLRGSGIRVTPAQLPELHEAVTRLSAMFGMQTPPETYVVHGGGALNALATRFAGRDIVVLYSDLLDACEGNDSARDMIIAHELGHVHRGHLRWAFLIAPAMIVPFVGSAYSRAREYTCDRYGLAGAGDREGALLGLTVLAAGRRLARKVDRHAFVAQRAQLDTGLMTIGEWFSTHPPLAKRLQQLDPTLGPPEQNRVGAWRAAAIVGAVLIPVLLTGTAAAVMHRGGETSSDAAHEHSALPPEVAYSQAREDLRQLARFLHAEVRAGRELPWDGTELYERWNAAHEGRPEPRDPYDGLRYGYDQKGEHFRLWSVGPDGPEGAEPHDLRYDSRRDRTAE